MEDPQWEEGRFSDQGHHVTDHDIHQPTTDREQDWASPRPRHLIPDQHDGKEPAAQCPHLRHAQGKAHGHGHALGHDGGCNKSVPIHTTDSRDEQGRGIRLPITANTLRSQIDPMRRPKEPRNPSPTPRPTPYQHSLSVLTITTPPPSPQGSIAPSPKGKSPLWRRTGVTGAVPSTTWQKATLPSCPLTCESSPPLPLQQQEEEPGRRAGSGR